MKYDRPDTPSSNVSVRKRYENFTGGRWVAPSGGQYFTNTSPVDGGTIAEFPRSSVVDIDLALDAAHAARESWGRTPVAERSKLLLDTADRIEENLELLAVAETWNNGEGEGRRLPGISHS